MSGVNRIIREQDKRSIFPDMSALLNSANSWNQGDLLILDTTAHTIRKATVETEMLTFMGIAEQTVVSGKLADPYVTDVSASQAASSVPGPVYGVVAKLVLNTGDALSPGSLVYANTSVGPYHVTATGTQAIGIYQGPAISSALAGQTVEVLLGHRSPSGSPI